MDVNKDEAARCLALSWTHLHSGRLDKAIKFAEKSISLFQTDEAVTHLAALKKKAEAASATPSPTTSEPTASASGAQAHPSAAGTTHRHGGSANGGVTPEPSSSKQKSFTPDQEKVVKRVITCKATAYYDIMGLKKDCDENDVKKAYKKLALQLHPDKNSAPGADEAFKLVAKAFTVLSDSNKRAIYDQNGADPDVRFGGGGGGMDSMFTGMGRRGGGATFQGDINPEDIFNMFFSQNGGFGGTGFGGPGVSFTFGPGGFTTMNGGGFPRRGQRQQQQQAAPQDARSTFVQLLPLLILFALSFISSLPSLFSFSDPIPSYSFAPTSTLNQQKTTSRLQVPYFVSASEYSQHPMWEGVTPDGTSPPPKKVKLFELGVEKTYINNLRYDCSRRLEDRERKMERYGGVIFGVGRNEEMMKKLAAEKYESCELLQKFQRQGYL